MAHGPVLTRPEHVRRQKWSRAELPSISAAPQDNNKFVWNVTIMGDLDGGWYENGIYHLTLSFSPDFPEVHPRPRFATRSIFRLRHSVSFWPGPRVDRDRDGVVCFTAASAELLLCRSAIDGVDDNNVITSGRRVFTPAA